MVKIETNIEGEGLESLRPLSSTQLIRILGRTIKNDDENKLTTFLCMLSAYTEDSQFNISFIAPSSTGKSYIAMEEAKLFPEEDVLEIGYCTPTAFFHDYGTWDKEKKQYTVDLSRKIIIFLDQPHTKLLERLRPLLSHDKKLMKTKITDKSQKFGLRTKTVCIKGFPAVVFCSAGMRIDEQESTRFFLLSPETDQSKLRASIQEKIKMETNKWAYRESLNDDPERQMLIERIKAVKEQHIVDIRIPFPDKIEEVFLGPRSILKPRHQRDVGRLMSLTKIFTLLNYPFRELEEDTLVATEEDLTAAVEIWEKISESQENNVSPFVFQIYQNVIIPAFKDRQKENEKIFMNEENDSLMGISMKELSHKFFEVYGRVLPPYQIRQDILPSLETAGLVQLEQDPSDRRKKLIYPTTLNIISSSENNNEMDGGVPITNNNPSLDL